MDAPKPLRSCTSLFPPDGDSRTGQHRASFCNYFRDATFPALVPAVIPHWRPGRLDCRLRFRLVSPHRDALFYLIALRRNERSSEKRRRSFATGEP
jgi:hypothetical protein